MLPPNFQNLQDLDDSGDGGGSSSEEGEGYGGRGGKTVVRGFPELLQRACDKEADARVLLQTEYGLSRRREAKQGRGGKGGGERGEDGKEEGEGIKGKEGREGHGRSLSDGDLFVDTGEGGQVEGGRGEIRNRQRH